VRLCARAGATSYGPWACRSLLTIAAAILIYSILMPWAVVRSSFVGPGKDAIEMRGGSAVVRMAVQFHVYPRSAIGIGDIDIKEGKSSRGDLWLVLVHAFLVLCMYQLGQEGGHVR
jgi:hypothetical protein